MSAADVCKKHDQIWQACCSSNLALRLEDGTSDSLQQRGLTIVLMLVECHPLDHQLQK